MSMDRVQTATETRDDSRLIRVLFVCTGNICRSPTAEAIFNAQAKAQGLADMFEADSAGTTDYHQGEPADRRSITAAKKRGYDMSNHRARHIRDHDFTRFDYIVALDHTHLQYLKSQQKRLENGSSHIVTLMDYIPEKNRSEDQKTDVPDPYYGGPAGFDLVLDLSESGCAGLIAHIIADTKRKNDAND